MRIRWLYPPSDLEDCVRIENESFLEYQWSKKDFQTTLEEKNVIGYAADVDFEVRGFLIYKFTKVQVDILNFAVDPLFRRRGIATKLFEWLMMKFDGNGKRDVINCIVHEKNLPAQIFLRKQGFKARIIADDTYIFSLYKELTISDKDLDKLFHGECSDG